MYKPPEEKNPEQRIFTMAIYVISALGAIVQYAESLSLVVEGCIVLAVAGFMLKAQRVTAKGTIYASHVEWIGRTMSIGSCFLFPLSIAATLYFVYTQTEIKSLWKVVANADNADMAFLSSVVRGFIDHNADKIDRITSLAITPPIFWWVRRCWYGLVRADRSEPIDFPHSLL